MPKVSVIIPVYNVEPYLARSLDSVCGQTLEDIEIICINDCSPDNSLAILQEYAERDSRIKIIDFKENKGVSVARNTGIDMAQGEYIGFVDSDDYIDLNFYEELYKKAVEKDANIVKCPRKVHQLDKTCIVGPVFNNILKTQDKFTFTYEWTTAIYRRSLIKDHNIYLPENISHSEDVIFLFKFLLYANQLDLIDNVFYHYIKRENSLTADCESIKALDSVKASQMMLEYLNSSSLVTNDNDKYFSLYADKLHYFISSFYKANVEGKQSCIDALVWHTKQCHNIDKLKKNFRYPFLLSEIGNKEHLLEKMLPFKSDKELFLHQLRMNARSKSNA